MNMMPWQEPEQEDEAKMQISKVSVKTRITQQHNTSTGGNVGLVFDPNYGEPLSFVVVVGGL